MHIKNKTGQITVEYILVVTAVLLVIVAFVSNRNGPFQNTMNQTFNTAVTEINTEITGYGGTHDNHASTDLGTPQGVTVDVTNGIRKANISNTSNT